MSDNPIPHTIHYCWFGRNPLPKSAQKCIESWRRYFPGWEIKEWNESNFDVNIIPYTRQAYQSKKYAFVSDYARFWILYNYGGVYFDTDVEVLKPFDDVLARGPFMGREAGSYIRNICDSDLSGYGVNPGLGMGAIAGSSILKEILDQYSSYRFILDDGSLNKKTIVSYTTEALLKYGLSLGSANEPEKVGEFWIYPTDFFCPMDHTRGNIIELTDRTHSIHRYDATWNDHKTIRHKLHLVKNWMMRTFGPERVQKLIDLFKKC